jgi:hypothetical protein
MSAINGAAAVAGNMTEFWRVGSVVSGRVLEDTPGTRMIVEIEGLTVSADPPSTGAVPRQFRALVIGGGSRPALEVLTPTGAKPPVAMAVRPLLARQGGLQPLLADLYALGRATQVRSLPAPVRAALARLEASIVERGELLDPDLLRDALLRSGLQLEHTLLEKSRGAAQTPAARVDYDIKAALTRLAKALQEFSAEPTAGARQAEVPPPLLALPLQPQARAYAPATPDAVAMAANMVGHVEAALARIGIMQLQVAQVPMPQACMVEIPVRGSHGFDVLQVRIDEEPVDETPDAPAKWTLEFTFEPPELGAIQGQIRLCRDNVQVDLWAELAATLDALEKQTAVLGRLLGGSGLQLVQLRVRHGLPTRYTGLGSRFVDAVV